MQDELHRSISALIFLSATFKQSHSLYDTRRTPLHRCIRCDKTRDTSTDASVNILVESAVAETADFRWAVFTGHAITDDIAEVLDAVTPVI
jgi:hypothetical protein